MAVWLSVNMSQGVPNEAARTNTVTASVIVHYSGGSYNGNSPSGTLTINGQSFSFTCNFNYAGIGQGAASQDTGSVTACTRTVTVSYGSSGTKTVSASASFNSGVSSGTVTAGNSITLTPISATGGSDGGDDGDEGDDGDDSGSGSGSNPGNDDIIVSPDFTGNTTPAYVDGLNGQIGDSSGRFTILRFTAPEFEGMSTSVDVAIKARYDEDSNTIQRIAIALCTSYDNYSSYVKAGEDVDDEYQIAATTMTIVGNGYGITNIPTNEILSGVEYFLIIWIPSNSISGYYYLDSIANHRIKVNYGDVVSPTTKDVVFIDIASEYARYECFIDNGTTWDKYKAYIDNGTTFEPYG